MSYAERILDVISGPSDLKCLENDELEILCTELREEMIRVTSTNGGHLASSLGATEIIVALHSLMDCPKDRIVFDVGHQAYAHKLLTGRCRDFSTLRQFGGITGFPNPAESEYDVHPSGHASDSLSIALGLAKARDLNGTDQKIATVIGDASLSGGMAFEALNHIGQEKVPMVIVLNDNGMSISRPVGALVRHLSNLRMSDRYIDTRESIQEAMEDGGRMGESLLNLGRNMKDSVKHLINSRSMVFEQLGIVCTPPIDGHDICALREAFRAAFNSKSPVLVHVVTKKGAGYLPAEKSPERFHGIGPFDIETGESVKKPAGAPSFTSVFGKALVDEALRDDSVVAITAAMPSGTGLGDFAERFPERFFDTGITEEHAMGMAAGLAFGGKKPVVAMYSTFLQRAIDQVAIDVALPKANVVMAIDRAGLVGDDGPTHHGAFDLAYLRMIPNVRVIAPSDEAELVNALHTALELEGPVALRYPRGEAMGAPLPEEPQILPEGKSRVVREGDDAAILAFGCMVKQAKAAADILEEKGLSVRVVDMRWVKPLDLDALRAAMQTGCVLTVEDGALAGGAGSAVAEKMAAFGSAVRFRSLGLPDEFVPQGKQPQLYRELGIDGQGIAEALLQLSGKASVE